MSPFVVLAFFVAYASAACNAPAGFDLSSIDGTEQSYQWSNGQFVDMAFCTTINTACGSPAAQPPPICASKPNGCAGVCQRWTDGDGNAQGASLGTYQSAIAGTGYVSLFYSGGDPVPDPPGPRVAYINISCQGGATLSFTQFIQPSTDNHQPNQPYVYVVLGTDSSVCGGGPGPSGGGIAGGGVFLILFFILPTLYLIGGIAFNKIHLQKEGAEMIPNYEFWVESPHLFLAGCAFTWAKITGLCGKENYSTIS